MMNYVFVGLCRGGLYNHYKLSISLYSQQFLFLIIHTAPFLVSLRTILHDMHY